jgi:hypothetical protein
MVSVIGITHPEHRTNWAFYMHEKISEYVANHPDLPERLRHFAYDKLVNQGFSRAYAESVVY